jgi:hypothetical protein
MLTDSVLLVLSPFSSVLDAVRGKIKAKFVNVWVCMYLYSAERFMESYVCM